MAKMTQSHLSKSIPRVSYADIVSGLSSEQIQAVKNTGTIIVTGAVPKTVSMPFSTRA